MKSDPCVIPYAKINSKRITKLYLRPKTVRLIEENLEEKLHDIGLSTDRMDMTPKHR